MVKDLVVCNDSSQIKQVIYTLEHDFTLSSNPNSRKGGLVGLAAASIALGRVSFSIVTRDRALYLIKQNGRTGVWSSAYV